MPEETKKGKHIISIDAYEDFDWETADLGDAQNMSMLKDIVDDIRRKKQFIQIHHEWFQAYFNKKTKRIIVKKATISDTKTEDVLKTEIFGNSGKKEKLSFTEISEGVFSIVPDEMFLFSINKFNVIESRNYFDIHLGKLIYIKKKDGSQEIGRLIHICDDGTVTYIIEKLNINKKEKINIKNEEIDEIRIDSFKLEYTYSNIHMYASLEDHVGSYVLVEIQNGEQLWFDEQLYFKEEDIKKIEEAGFRTFLVIDDKGPQHLVLFFERGDERFVVATFERMFFDQCPTVIKNVIKKIMDW